MNNKKKIKVSFTKAIDLITEYLDKKYKIDVIYTLEDDCCYDQNNDCIILNKHISIKEKFYILLHEAGHCIQHNDINYSLLYPKSSSCTRGFNPTKAERVDILREESDAWFTGFILVNDILNIAIDMKEYSFYNRKYVWTYIDWCVDHKKNNYKPLKERTAKKN